MRTRKERIYQAQFLNIKILGFNTTKQSEKGKVIGFAKLNLSEDLKNLGHITDGTTTRTVQLDENSLIFLTLNINFQDPHEKPDSFGDITKFKEDSTIDILRSADHRRSSSTVGPNNHALMNLSIVTIDQTKSDSSDEDEICGIDQK